ARVSYGNRSSNVGMGVIIDQFEIFVAKGQQIGHCRVNVHPRQRTWLARELERGLFQMIVVQVGVAERVNKFTRLKFGHPRYHHSQQSIRGDIKRYAQEYIGTSLVKLAGKSALRHV